jgi:hypothetical protein
MDGMDAVVDVELRSRTGWLRRAQPQRAAAVADAAPVMTATIVPRSHVASVGPT